MIWGIGIAVIVSSLAQLALHWLPWQLLLGRDLPRPAAYMLGTSGIALPLTGLFWAWGFPGPILALWAVVVGSGLAVLAGYLLDAWLHDRQARHECEEREMALLQEVK